MDDTMILNDVYAAECDNECDYEQEVHYKLKDVKNENIDTQQITEYKMESIYETSYYITMGLINIFIMYIIFGS